MKIIKVKSLKHGEKDCFVDDSDFDFLNQWSWHLLVSYHSQYAVRKKHMIVNGKPVYKAILMHRLILGINDSKILCDHKDQNGLNNQRYNLRPCTKKQNNCNIKSHKDSISKYLGVTWDKSRELWKVHISGGDRVINVGRFKIEEEAALAYNRKAIEIHGEFASLNKIP